MHPHSAIEDLALARSQYTVFARLWVDDLPTVLPSRAVLLDETYGLPGGSPFISATITADLEEPVVRAEIRFSRLTNLNSADNDILSPYMSEARGVYAFTRPILEPGMYVLLETKCVGTSPPDSTATTPPVYVGAGAKTQGSASNPVDRLPQWPTGHQAGDIGILVLKTANQAPTFTNLRGFAAIGSVGTGVGGGGAGVVAHDASSKSATFTTATGTWTHTPVGTPKGVKVTIHHAEDDTDHVTGTVSYGGVAMTRVTTARVTSGGLEKGRSYLYFLGASIPTGPQTVSVAHDGLATTKIGFCETFTASTNTEVVVSGILESVGTANPQITLDSGTRSALISYAIYSGLNDPTNLTLIAGQSANQSHDFGGTVCRSDRETAASTGSRTVGYTATSEKCAMVAMAIAEVPSAGAAIRTDLYWCRATSNAMAPPEVNVPSDHVVCQIVGVRGCVPTGNPVHVFGGETAAASTSIGIGLSGPTTIPNCLFVGVVAHAIDSTNPQCVDAAWISADFTGVTERSDVSGSAGTGGGFGIVTAIKANPGGGAVLGTLLTSSVQARYALALEPAPPNTSPQDPGDLPWRPVFIGRIDSTDPASGSEVVLHCRDRFCDVLDTWVEPGPTGGWLMGDEEIQDHLTQLLTISNDIWVNGATVTPVPLAIVGDPDFFIPAFLQQPGSKLLAMRQAGLQRGWDLRGKWGVPPYTENEFVLAYYEPDRSLTGSTLVLRPDRYFDVTSFPLSREEVRNVVEVTPSDPPRLPVKVFDSPSIFAYGRKYMGLTYDVASHISTTTQATTLATAVLSDTKDPAATMEIDIRYQPFVEINDLVYVVANGVHHDTDLVMAVSGYTHTLTTTRRRTVLRLRPAPSAAYRYWRSGQQQMQFSSTAPPTGAAPEGSLWVQRDA